MLTKAQALSISLCAISLSGCMIDGQGSRNDYQPYNYQNSQLYPEGYDNAGYYGDQTGMKKEVVIPESYHVGVDHSPVAPKDLDRAWVNNQNPQGYTIEVADDEKASRVAGALQKAPKSERMAEVHYQRGGKAYYKGLYGSYPSMEAAQQALSAMPADVKAGAGVKQWSSVQNSVSE